MNIYFPQKSKGGTDLGTGGEVDTLYDGRITDAAIDGSIDYKGRPANKATTGRWHGASYLMGNLCDHVVSLEVFKKIINSCD